MKILLDGYADNNFGDDLMLTLAAKGLAEHELYTPYEEANIENVQYTTARNGFDVYLKVTGSGFLIHNIKGIFYRMRDIQRENGYAKKKAVINCNISPFVNKTAEIVIQSQLKGYNYITVRDEHSHRYISKNAPKVKCEKYPDMVFAMPDEMIPDVPCENALGIAIRNGTDCGELAKIADGYVKNTGNKVKIFCFDSGKENDALSAERMYRSVKYGDKVETVVYKNIPDMLAEMKKCSIILGVRFHSNVLAARMGIPFVPMAYSDKTVNALDEIGYIDEIYNYKSFNADVVIDRILNAKPFKLDDEIIISAQQHILRFKEYIKKQG